MNPFATLDAPIVAAPSAWTGHFVYETGDGGPVHSLRVAPGRCRLTTRGDGWAEEVPCDAITRDDSLILLARGGGRYRAGLPLVKLTREDGGIVTGWLNHAHAPAARVGRHFDRRWR